MSAGSLAAESGFDRSLAAIADVDGWLTEAQAKVLHDRASELQSGARVVEIGSYHGRSTIVLASALPEGAEVIAIDSHDGDNRGPQQVHGQWQQGQADCDRFRQNLRNSHVEHRVQHIRARSGDALGLAQGPIDLLYIDGAHQFRAARQDIHDWGARVTSGGTMLVHDGFSSIGVTLALLSEQSVQHRAGATLAASARSSSIVASPPAGSPTSARTRGRCRGSSATSR